MFRTRGTRTITSSTTLPSLRSVELIRPWVDSIHPDGSNWCPESLQEGHQPPPRGRFRDHIVEAHARFFGTDLGCLIVDPKQSTEQVLRTPWAEFRVMLSGTSGFGSIACGPLALWHLTLVVPSPLMAPHAVVPSPLMAPHEIAGL